MLSTFLRSLSVIGLAAVLTQPNCFGQSFNVDLDTTGGSAGSGVPSSSYGSGGGQPGTWNAIRSTNPVTSTLVGLNGAPTAATFTRATNGQFVNLNNSPATSGDFEALVDDIYTNNILQTMAFSFNNLQAGTYVVYSYAFNAEFPNQMNFVTVNGAIGQVQQASGGGPLNGNRAIPGAVYTAHGVTVNAGGTITIQVQPNNFWPVSIAGFQIKRLPTGQRNRVYVKTTANGDGGSWPDAMKDMQGALEVARRAGGSISEVWVGQGFYRPTLGTNRSISFDITDKLHLYGGFAGLETSLAQRTAPEIFITVMTGSIGAATTDDNTLHVLRMTNATDGTIVDGFSIAQGTANGSGLDSRGGGALLINSSPLFRNTKFLGNRASFRGAGVDISGGAPRFAECLFFNNDCTNGDGGGVYHAAAGDVTAKAKFGNTRFYSNQSVGSGAAAYFNNAPGQFINCIVSGNSSSATQAHAGGIYATGNASAIDLINSTIVSNKSFGSFAGVAASTGAQIKVHNTILWANADQSGATIANQQAGTITPGNGFVALGFAWVQGINPSPQFVDIDGSDNIPGNFDDDLRLKITSPCIDAGNNALLPLDALDLNQNGITSELVSVDIDRNPRRADIPTIPNTGIGTAPIVDYGAFENQPPTCIGDLNNDGIVDAQDLGILLATFGCVSSCNVGDLNNNGIVDAQDLGILLAVFGQSC